MKTISRIKCRAMAAALLVVLALFIISPAAFAQNIREISPGHYEAGILSSEFQYFSAPETVGKQRMSNWCWAASIQMVLNFYGIRVSQEELVNRLFGGLVNKPANAYQIASALSGWAMTANGQQVRIQAYNVTLGSDIVQDVAYKRPMIVGLNNPNGTGGHAYVLTAVRYRVDANNQPLFTSFVLRDPWPTNKSRIEVPANEFFRRAGFIMRVWVTPM